MSKDFSLIANDIEKNLLDLGERLIEFTIGKTDNPNDRECDYQNKCYTHFCEICQGPPAIINQGEKFLIDYFANHATLKEKMGNERSGGAGNPKADILYVAIRNKESNIDDLDGSILPIGYPLKF